MTLRSTTCENLNISTFKAVVFDLDDTIYPEQQYSFSGFRAVADYIRTLYQLDIFDELVHRYLAGERTNVFGATLGRHFKRVENELIRRMVYVYWSHTPRVDLYDDARICMALLISRHIPIGLLVTGQSSIQRKKVAALGIEPLLDALVYADDLLGPKQPCQPSEDAFHILALQMETDFPNMLFIGDNPLVDFVTPRRLGIKTARIRRKHGEHVAEEPPTPDHAPDYTLTSLESLVGAFTAADSVTEGDRT